MVRTRRFYGLVTWKSKVTGTMKTGMIVGLLLILLVGWIISAQRRLTAMDENIKNAMGQIGVQLFSRYEAEIALLELLQPHGEELWKTARWLQEKRRTVTAETEPANAAEQGALLSEAQRILLEAVERCPAAQENKNCRNYLNALDSYGKMLQTSTLIYNDTVSKFNQSIRPFPMNVAARLLHFQKKAYLEMR